MGSIVIEHAATGRGLPAGRTVRIAALLLLLGFLVPPAASPGPDAAPRTFERLSSLPGLANFGRVAPGIFRGGQPNSEGYATLKAMGVKTVINLRTRHGERKAVEAVGMRYVEIPMSFRKKADPATVRKALSVITDPANQPVFFHCLRGTDRSGVVTAVYRMEVDGWSKAEAEAEMEALGYQEILFQLKRTVKEWRSGG